MQTLMIIENQDAYRSEINLKMCCFLIQKGSLKKEHVLPEDTDIGLA